MMKSNPIIILMMVSFFLLAAGAAAETIQVQNAQVNSIGSSIPVSIVLDTSAAGLAGYDITISLSNSTVATITCVSFPSWAVLNQSILLPASSVRLRALDLDKHVNASATNVSFAAITLRGEAVGSTDIVVAVKEVTADGGSMITPGIQSGKFTVGATRSQPVIANHTITNLSQIPQSAIADAKTQLHIAYGHTSHGSQIVDGMDGLTGFVGAPYGGSSYEFNNGGTGGALDFRDELGNYDKLPYGAADLGNPNYTAFAGSTRLYLQTHPTVNVILWSWCGQADTSEENINTYLNLMNGLESEFPNVTFVYMTGHLVGSGEEGNLNLRNEQIRNYARTYNKVLFDFADLESYDPDGVNYGDKYANDACNYDNNNNGYTEQDGNGLPINGDKNWALDWQNSHTEGIDWYSCGAAHSQPLNANQKAYAAWWLWARLGGWDGTPVPGEEPVAEFTATPLTGTGPLTVQFNDTSSHTPTGWAWKFGDGGTSPEQNATHNFIMPGTYTVDLTATNGYGSDTISKPAYITVTASKTQDMVGVFRPSKSRFYLKNGSLTTAITFGSDTDTPITGDWNGDGLYEVGVYRNSTSKFYLRNGSVTTGIVFGTSEDTPIIGDWNGDGLWEVGVFRNTNNKFYLRNGSATTTIKFGSAGDTPVTGDWNGDGLWDVGVYRNSTGRFYLRNGSFTTAIIFGSNGDKPVTGDWNGDSQTDVGVFHTANASFLLRNGVTTTQVVFGLSTDKPITGIWS